MDKLIASKRTLAIIERSLAALAVLGATFPVWCTWAGLPERLAPLGIVAMAVFLFLSLMATIMRRMVPNGTGNTSTNDGAAPNE